jgi:hypothetical protein
MDGPPDLGGRNLGPRPMEMLLLGTGGCASFDVLSMLKKSRQKVVDCRVELDADRALYWLSVGAQPSDAVARMLKSKGVYAALEASRAGAAG